MYSIKKIARYYLLFLIINAKWISCAKPKTTPKPPAIPVKIEQLSSNDKPTVSSFLHTAYYRDEPELKSMNVTNIHPIHDEYLVNVIDEGYSYGAYAENGTLLGVLLMGPGFINRYSPINLKKEIDNCKIEYFRKLLIYNEALLEFGKALTANPEKSLHLEVAATTPTARRKGVMRKLVQHAMDLAKRKELKMITCAGASQYMGNLCESLGWRCMVSLPLLSITDRRDDKPIFTTIHQPHGFAIINVVDIK